MQLLPSTKLIVQISPKGDVIVRYTDGTTATQRYDSVDDIPGVGSILRDDMRAIALKAAEYGRSYVMHIHADAME